MYLSVDKKSCELQLAGFFFPGGDWGFHPPPPPSGKIFCQFPSRHLSPFLDQDLSPPTKVPPRKFEKFKYIFVSNLTTFKLKSTLKSCSKKWHNFALGGQFWLQSGFFRKFPPYKKILSPPIKYLEKKPWLLGLEKMTYLPQNIWMHECIGN